MSAEAKKTREELEPVTIKVKPALLKAIDAGEKIHGEGRGQFIRNAIADRLEKLGYKLEPEVHLAPARKGVGGQPTHKRSGRKISLDSQAQVNGGPQLSAAPVALPKQSLPPHHGQPQAKESDPSRDSTVQAFVGAIAVEGGKKALRSLGLPEKAASTNGNSGVPKRVARTKTSAQQSPANLVPK